MTMVITKTAVKLASVCMAFWILTSYLQVINSNTKQETSGMLDSSNFFVVAEALV